MEDIIVGKYVVKTDRYYTKDHEWALVKGNKAWIGITDYAQKELGDVVYIDLPQVGESYESGDTIANVESVKSVSPIYAPLSGTVVEVNETLSDVPMYVEVKLDVEDSPNSAGSMIDAVRCCKLARDRGIGGPLYSISAYTMKHPPIQYPDWQARKMVEEFIRGERER